MGIARKFLIINVFTTGIDITLVLLTYVLSCAFNDYIAWSALSIVSINYVFIVMKIYSFIIQKDVQKFTAASTAIVCFLQSVVVIAIECVRLYRCYNYKSALSANQTMSCENEAWALFYICILAGWFILSTTSFVVYSIVHFVLR